MKFIRTATYAAVATALLTWYCTAEDSTMDDDQKWAWSVGAGWLNAKVNTTNGGVIGQYICSGYLYSEGSGWVSLGDGSPTSGVYYSNANSSDYGVNHDGQGHLTGYAWCESTGWINFEWTNKENADAPKVSLESGILSGYVWGDALGWISLSNISAHVKSVSMSEGTSAETNNDFIPDAWEMQWTGTTNLDVLGAGTNDYDNDGITDYNEYIAGTSPVDSNDYFWTSGAIITNSTNLFLTWPCTNARSYKIEKNADLTDSGGWTDSGLGIFSPGSGRETSVSIPMSETQQYYRVMVILPLSE